MGYIISYGYSQGVIWFYNLRASQICFWNDGIKKLIKIELRTGVPNECHNIVVFIFPKYGNFWSALLGDFIKHKPLISEEWQGRSRSYLLLNRRGAVLLASPSWVGIKTFEMKIYTCK